MNIMLQVAGFFVMIAIFIFYFNYRRAAVKSNRIFLYQGLAIFVSVFLDISSIILINTPSMTYSFLTYALCKLYLGSCLVVVFFGFIYVLNDVSSLKKRKTRTFYKYGALVILIVGITLALSLKLNIVYDPEGLNDYTEGWPVIVTYIFTFVFMAATIGLALIRRKQMYRKRFIGVWIFIGLWTFGAAVQGIINYLLSDLGIIILSVSFAESLGSLVIYMMLENPALNIDRVTGALTQRAFEEYIDYCYDKELKKEFVLIEYDNTVASSIMDYNAFAKAITNQLLTFNAQKIFRNDKNNFIIVRDDLNKRSIIDSVYAFKDQFYRENHIISEIPFKILYFKDINLFYNTKDLLDAANYLCENKSNVEKEIIIVDEEVANKIHEKFVMDKKCDVAFSKRNVEVFFQPIYSNNDLSFTSAEALVRLKDEDGNIIYPSSFIEEMERDGRIVELGKIVFEDVCKFINENDMEALGLKYIEVNLSAVQCMQENLASTYIEIMQKYKINPKYINLEITETAQSTRITLLKNMQILRDYGVSFSLDDFGTGNSNLNYIVEMPVQIVKFDKTMVNSYFENRIASYVMNSTIDMIKGLGHKIVFEGIEREDQINQVKNLNVDYIQGYFYSKPIDKIEFVKFIKASNNLA